MVKGEPLSTIIVPRPTSDKDVRQYHVDGEQICDLLYAEFYRPLWGDPEENFTALGPKGKMIAEKLMDQSREREIERISFQRDSIRVRRAPTAD